MNFKRIEMYGFKSFADKLEIKFDHGITGIVGPNGCGKSNVADSIRWVLGEQSAKSLRGNNMLDVIFNGTSQRKSLSYCEVALVFDNSEKKIPLDYSEIIITRKLYRSGESEYCINRTPCRLKDITDLLRDMGIAKEGYTIIGQGKVDEIISSKPVDRRGIFEEACGISKFKARKIETERKLGRTHENLIRLGDILSELERQVTPLEKQSEIARKFLELKEHLKYHEINSFIVQYESVSTKKEGIQKRLNAISEELALRSGEYSKADAAYDKCMEEISGIDSDIERFRDSQLELSLGLEKQSGEIKLLRERAGFLQQNLDRLTAQRESQQSQLAYIRQNILDKTENKKQKDGEFAALKVENEKLNDKFLSIVELLTARETDSEDAQQEIVVSMEKLSEIKANFSSLVAEKKALTEQKSKLSGRLDTTLQTKDNYEKESETLSAKLSSLKNARQEKIAEREQDVLRSSRMIEEIKETREELFSFEQYKSGLLAKQNLLQRIQDNFEGYQRSVKQLLFDGKNNNDIKNRIIGTVAQLMTVPKEFETAVDVSLGQAMQNVVVHEEQDAKYLIAYLKNKKYGRVTFLPVETVKGRMLDNSVIRSLSSCPGYLGVASDLVSYLPKFTNIYQGLLGRTVFADNIDNAVIIARKCSYTVRIVTLDGDIIHPFGAMTGGSRAVESSNLLGGEREMADITSEIARSTEKITTLKTKLTELENLQRELSDLLKKLDETLKNLDLELASIAQKQAQTLSQVSQIESEYNGYAQENLIVSTRIDAIESDLKLVDELSGMAISQKDLAAEQKSRQKQEFDRFKLQRDQLLERITENKVSLASLNSQSVSLESELLRLSGDVEELISQLNKSEIDIDSLTASIAELSEGEKNVVLDEKAQEKLNEIRQKLSSLDSFKKELQARLTELDTQKEELSSEIGRVTELKYKEENSLLKVDSDIEFMQDKIQEEYACDYEAACSYRDKDYDSSVGQAEINRTKRQITALGFVNVNAIEDYKVLKERFDEMDKQKKDLESAEEDLRQIIAELTVEMLERFTKGFNDIAANFQKVFKELFGGGNAKLVLEHTEDGDPLSAGIDIVAEPPGKKLQSITLLSGGEKALTAIAILFAILKLKPMPFCVLDEIEAALDDSNTDRFARYLKKFSDVTQFIVITHKKPTMELTDALYGVTMEEKGVSKMVSVKLAEAIQVIEKAV